MSRKSHNFYRRKHFTKEIIRRISRAFDSQIQTLTYNVSFPENMEDECLDIRSIALLQWFLLKDEGLVPLLQMPPWQWPKQSPEHNALGVQVTQQHRLFGRREFKL